MPQKKAKTASQYFLSLLNNGIKVDRNKEFTIDCESLCILGSRCRFSCHQCAPPENLKIKSNGAARKIIRNQRTGGYYGTFFYAPFLYVQCA